MKKIIALGLLAGLMSCQSNHPEYLVQFGGNEDENISPGYVNANGETIIAPGKYVHCFTDTIKTMGVVMSTDFKYYGINKKDEILFEIYPYDNGPDYESEGLFRIIKDGKIGFANNDGKTVIEPIYACAFPFESGKAKVALNCTEVPDGEYTLLESEEWFFIDVTGKKLEE